MQQCTLFYLVICTKINTTVCFSLVVDFGLYLSFLQNMQWLGRIGDPPALGSLELLLSSFGPASSAFPSSADSFNKSFLWVNADLHVRWYCTGISGHPFSPTGTAKIPLCFLICAAPSNVIHEFLSLHSLKLAFKSIFSHIKHMKDILAAMRT